MPLWEDVQNTAERCLESLGQSETRNVQDSTNRHFLGAVVLKQERTAASEVEKRLVVDGQQRIMTLQLLLAAVEGVCREVEHPASERLLTYVKNNERIYRGDDLYKLRPSSEDKEPFQRAIDAASGADNCGTVEEAGGERGLVAGGASLVVRAYDYFRAQAEDWVQRSGSDEVGHRIEALEAAVTSLVHMVVIGLEEPDDPNVIFETLNARGTPLLESDLIKNYMISRLGANSRSGVWKVLEDGWWRKQIAQGRLQRARIEVALHYWLTMRTASEVPSSKMFDGFKVYAKALDANIVIQDIKSILGKYRVFQTSDGLKPDNKRFRTRMQVMQMGVVTPVLLRLLDSCDQSDPQFVQALNALESFMVRRMVCRMTTKDYNSMMQSLLKAFDADETSDVDHVVVKFLKESEADARIWPDDGMIKDKFFGLGIYRLLTRGRLRLVLEGIEEQMRAGDSYAEHEAVHSKLSIEHVMPQKWWANWPLDPSAADREEAERERSRHLHTIGNLTLTTSRLNASLSNASWQSKRQTLDNHSILFLNKELVRHEAWDEQAIAARSEHLAGVFARAWPGPDSSYWGSPTAG